MEAQLVEKIPAGADWQYEPKWDGFRCLAFRNEAQLELQSKSGQSLTRYFPELVDSLLKLKAKQFVLDGEIIIPTKGGSSFDDLLLRIHPAKSRVEKLALETPARFLVFDLLVDAAGKSLAGEPLKIRRRELEGFTKQYFQEKERLQLSPRTRTLATAQKWLNSARIGFDGVVAKRLDLPYASGERTAMQKIKRMRTADCVVGGFRYASNAKVVGSLLLGLYDSDGLLHHVGFTSSFNAAEKKELTTILKPLIKPPGFTGNAPGGPSRWSTKRSAEWEPLETKLVIEVQYDHFSGGRFRHGTRLLRWRFDKKPRQCDFKQIPAAK
ncbi:MAG: ATP-dependent ligase [Acidobacteria bacterium]|nr:ATP-dependent ligase [Acidobacteriota bacterium]